MTTKNERKKRSSFLAKKKKTATTKCYLELCCGNLLIDEIAFLYFGFFFLLFCIFVFEEENSKQKVN